MIYPEADNWCCVSMCVVLYFIMCVSVVLCVCMCMCVWYGLSECCIMCVCLSDIGLVSAMVCGSNASV